MELVEDLRRPDLLVAAVAAVGPRGEERAGEAGEAVVVAVLVAAVGADDGLVGRAPRDLERRAPGLRRRRRRTGTRRRSSCGRVADRVVVDDRERAVGLVDRQPGVELVVQAGLVVDLPGADQVAPPSVERENQMRVLQADAVLVPGSLPALVQPVSPERSVQTA